MTDLTHDTISLRAAGIVSITQPAKGNRFTQDSILLADFCIIKPKDHVLEPGSGTGVISLLLAKKYPRARFTAVEIEPKAYDLLCMNIEENGLAGRIKPIHQDLRHLMRSQKAETLDVIIANPPYTPVGSGRRSPSSGRQIARQDEAGPLSSWIGLGRFLRNKGRFYIIFPAQRLAGLCALLRDQRLEPKRFRFIHPSATKPASLVLVEAMKSAGTGLIILPPLIVHNSDGTYADEVSRIYNPAP